MVDRAGGIVRVWRVALDAVPDWADRFLPRLSASEQARAGRFRADRHARRFVVAHAALREIVADRLGIAAEAVMLADGSHGKPALAGVQAASGVQFNLSHSGERALVALASHRSVGVDIERIAPMDNLDGMVARYFAPAEAAALRALPPDRRTRAFFACWTRKEAFVKALGQGLSFPLDRFEVSVDPDGPARLLSLDGDPARAARWSMTTLATAPGYLAALVAEAPVDGVDIADWRPRGA